MANPSVTININADEIIRQLRGIRGFAEKALSRGLNNAAFDLRRLWKADINTFIDKPTPFTKKVFVKKASPDNLIAITFLPRIQSEYLSKIIDGGLRRPGDIGTLSADILVPVNARLTQAGNFPRGSAVRFLATVEDKIKGAFIGSPGGSNDRGAVYQRFKSGKLKLLAVFEQTVEYNRQLPLERTVELFGNTADQFMQNALNKLLR